MGRKFLAKQGTVLKPGVLQSGTYGGAVVAIAAGQTIEAERCRQEGQHIFLELCIYGPHWESDKPDVPVTLEQIHAIAGNQRFTDTDYQDLISALERFKIANLPEIAHFLAQICHESGGFRWREELASGAAYEGRRDLGNTQPGDGRRFKGGGWLQTTGRYNYERLAEFVGDPRIVREGTTYVAKKYPSTAAAFWWADNRMSEYLNVPRTVEQVTKRVNGGYNGLADRKKYYARAIEVLELA